jgi:hypothetical protein
MDGQVHLLFHIQVCSQCAFGHFLSNGFFALQTPFFKKTLLRTAPIGRGIGAFLFSGDFQAAGDIFNKI